MAVRSTMSDLIAKARLLIGDPSGGSSQFSDQQIQDALDYHRMDIRYELLRALVTLAQTAIEYLDYYSDFGYWEADYSLVGPGYVALTASSAELLLDNAHFVFPVGAGPGQIPPVFLAGKSYDVYGAAAELLDMWAASVARAYNFSQDGASFSRSQMADGLMRMAAIYRRRARPKTAVLVRDDANLVGDGYGDPRRDAAGPVSAQVPFITGD